MIHPMQTWICDGGHIVAGNTMTVKVTCPLCGGEVVLYGEQHGRKEEGMEKGYFCARCDYAFFVDDQGRLKEPP